jgi:hypothetical protein
MTYLNQVKLAQIIETNCIYNIQPKNVTVITLGHTESDTMNNNTTLNGVFIKQPTINF